MSEVTIIAEWLLILICLPERPTSPAAVILLDPQSDRLFIKMLIEAGTGDETVDLLWGHLPEEFNRQARDLTGKEIIAELEGAWSNVFRVTDRYRIATNNLYATLDLLYAENVSGLGSITLQLSGARPLTFEHYSC